MNLDISSLTDKWYGESQKLASAVFTLARKIAPCIIFVDEVDSLLRSRDAHDHEATAMIKAQFMQMWDGLETTSESVVVMGATNRPRDVDRAILRRMPATFHVGLPDERQRNSIFRRILGMERVHDDVDYSRLAKLTEGFSGSDIREACRTASVYRMRELSSRTSAGISSEEKDGIRRCSCEHVEGTGDTSVKDDVNSVATNEESSSNKSAFSEKTVEVQKDLRAINSDDLLKAVGKLRETKIHCGFSAPKSFGGVGGLD